MCFPSDPWPHKGWRATNVDSCECWGLLPTTLLIPTLKASFCYRSKRRSAAPQRQLCPPLLKPRPFYGGKPRCVEHTSRTFFHPNSRVVPIGGLNREGSMMCCVLTRSQGLKTVKTFSLRRIKVMRPLSVSRPTRELRRCPPL